MTAHPLRVKYLVEERDERAGDRDLPLLSVSALRGVVPRSALTADEPRADDLSRYKVCHADDLVINRMSAYQGALGIAHQMGIVSPDYTVLRLSGIEPRFAHHLFRSRWFVGEMTIRLRGIGGSDQGNVRTPRINTDDLGEIRVKIPPPAVQRRIAAFLDAETARIGALIEKKQRMIELVEERFRAVTRATLVDSAPDQTDWVPLKHVAAYREGPGILAVDFRDEGVPLLRITNLLGDSVSLAGCGYLDPADVQARWEHLRVRTGDLLVSASATSGLPVIVPAEVDGAVPYTGLIRLWPRSEALIREYLRFFLASDLFERQVDRLKTGVAIQHWGPSHLGQVRMPFPPRARQEEAARSLTSARTGTLAVSDHLRRQIDLLREHRQALVTAAVTGRLNVAKAAA